jgi:hypothetical protein
MILVCPSNQIESLMDILIGAGLLASLLASLELEEISRQIEPIGSE